MLKEAIEKILSLAPPTTYQIDGHTYASKELELIDPPEDRPRNLEVSGLDSLCKLIKTELDKIGTTVMIRVVSYDRVEVFTTYLQDFTRYQLYSARADIPGFRTGFREREQALIELRSLFLVQGIALKANETIKPRVSLAPFRTFLEVEQPESEFLLRVSEDGKIGLFEADGGVWKLEAKQNICQYFDERLESLIEDNRVIVMM